TLASAIGWRSASWANLSKHKNRPGVVYWHGDPDEPKIALTFDDGPNDPYTSQILAVLKANNVKATFFMIGKNIERSPETAKAVAADGHVIGNHSYSHPDMIFSINSQVREELERGDVAIQKMIGVRPRLFRPPFGADDPFTIIQAEKRGYII